jgi:hypothetical protein
MPMQAESLEVLEKADIAPAQARAFVRAIEIEIAGAKDTLATKHDLLVMRTDLRGEMTELRTQLRGEMAEQGTQLRGEMGKLSAELRAELHGSIGAVIRQMYLAILGPMAVLLGFSYFFATHMS